MFGNMVYYYYFESFLSSFKLFKSNDFFFFFCQKFYSVLCFLSVTHLKPAFLQVEIFVRKMNSIPAFTANLTVESFNRRTLS